MFHQQKDLNNMSLHSLKLQHSTSKEAIPKRNKSSNSNPPLFRVLSFRLSCDLIQAWQQLSSARYISSWPFTIPTPDISAYTPVIRPQSVFINKELFCSYPSPFPLGLSQNNISAGGGESLGWTTMIFWLLCWQDAMIPQERTRDTSRNPWWRTWRHKSKKMKQFCVNNNQSR